MGQLTAIAWKNRTPLGRRKTVLLMGEEALTLLQVCAPWSAVNTAQSESFLSDTGHNWEELGKGCRYF